MGRSFGNSSSDDCRRRSRRFGGDEESEHQEDAHMQSWSQRTMLWCQSGRHEDACEAYKGDYELALALYDTGNYDAIYLVRLIADDDRMTKRDPQRWSPRPMVGLLLALRFRGRLLEANTDGTLPSSGSNRRRRSKRQRDGPLLVVSWH